MEALNDEMYFDGLQNEIHTTTVFPCFMNTRKEVINTLQKLEWVLNWVCLIECAELYFLFFSQYSVENANFFDEENRTRHCQWNAAESTPRVHAQICGTIPDTLWVSCRNLFTDNCFDILIWIMHCFQNYPSGNQESCYKAFATKQGCSQADGLGNCTSFIDLFKLWLNLYS